MDLDTTTDMKAHECSVHSRREYNIPLIFIIQLIWRHHEINFPANAPKNITLYSTLDLQNNWRMWVIV
jgi:hypothetical protein